MAEKPKYCVVRTDLMSGTQNVADLMSVRFYKGGSSQEAVENGVIAKVIGLEDGEREVYKVQEAADSDKLSECVLIASPELMKDERKVNLTEFINEKGSIARAYLLRSRNIFSLTKEGFATSKEPAKGDTVGIGENGKLDKDKDSFGKCIAIETAGAATYYVIEIGVVEAAAGE